jgi:hypothetical protein
MTAGHYKFRKANTTRMFRCKKSKTPPVIQLQTVMKNIRNNKSPEQVQLSASWERVQVAAFGPRGPPASANTRTGNDSMPRLKNVEPRASEFDLGRLAK